MEGQRERERWLRDWEKEKIDNDLIAVPFYLIWDAVLVQAELVPYNLVWRKTTYENDISPLGAIPSIYVKPTKAFCLAIFWIKFERFQSYLAKRKCNINTFIIQPIERFVNIHTHTQTHRRAREYNSNAKR